MNGTPSLLFSLEYQLDTDDWYISFDSPIPFVCKAGPFDLILKDGIAVIEMNEPYASDTEARKRVEPFLRSWEIATMLEIGAGHFQFRFINAKISNRETSSSEPSAAVRVSQLVVEVVVTRPQKLLTYPPEPTSFLADSSVQELWDRFQRYRAGKEPIAPMAYFCLTVIEGLGGNRHNVGVWRFAFDQV